MAKDTKKIKDKKEKKDNKTFFKDFKAELKKVTWPTAKQLATKTAVVIAIVLIISAIVFVLDKGYEFIVTKASSSINKDNTTDENATDTNSTDETTTDEATTTEDNAVENADQNVTTEEGTAE